VQTTESQPHIFIKPNFSTYAIYPGLSSVTNLKMAFSMHSHSGQFCPGHAVDNLEQVIQTAIARGMKTFGLTEHMPRNSDKDLYPEEVPLLSSHIIE